MLDKPIALGRAVYLEGLAGSRSLKCALPFCRDSLKCVDNFIRQAHAVFPGHLNQADIRSSCRSATSCHISNASFSPEQVHVAELHPFESCLPGSVQTLPGQLAGSRGKVCHFVVGMKRQETIGDSGVE